MPIPTQAQANAMRAQQLDRRLRQVDVLVAEGESVLDHSIARVRRTPNGEFKIEGFLLVTDRQLVFGNDYGPYYQSLKYEDMTSIKVKWKPIARNVEIKMKNDDVFVMDLGKTFAKSIRQLVRPRI